MEPTLVRIGFEHVILHELNLFDSSSLPRTLFQHAPALLAGPEKAVLKESREKPFNSAVYAQAGTKPGTVLTSYTSILTSSPPLTPQYSPPPHLSHFNTHLLCANCTVFAIYSERRY
jgi:hypothetical protein